MTLMPDWLLILQSALFLGAIVAWSWVKLTTDHDLKRKVEQLEENQAGLIKALAIEELKLLKLEQRFTEQTKLRNFKEQAS